MANAEGSDTPNADIVFRGIDGNECEAFVVAIRDLAFAKGKAGDRQWMLQYATTRLRYKALRWHAKLDPSAQDDWHLFVQALFHEYPLVEERDEVGIVTPVWTSTKFSPASSVATLPGNDRPLSTQEPPGTETGASRIAQLSSSLAPGDELVSPSRVYNSLLPGYQIGRLKVVYGEARPGPHYISASIKITKNIHEALTVTFIPSPNTHHIVCFDGRGIRLCVALCSPEYSELYQLSSTYDADDPVSMYSSNRGYFSNIWNISSDGTVRATLPDIIPDPRRTDYHIPSDCYATTTVYVDISGATISFAKDYSTRWARHPDSKLPIVRARIIFEPL